MSYGSRPWTKFDYARWCAASLAHLVLTQRDTAGLVLFDAEFRSKVRPGNGALQQREILDALEKAGITAKESQVSFFPKSTKAVSGEDAAKLLKLVDALDDHDDVANVYADFDVSDEDMANHS